MLERFVGALAFLCWPLRADAAPETCGNGVDDDGDGIVDNCFLPVEDFDLSVDGLDNSDDGDGSALQLGSADLTGDGTADLLFESASARGYGKVHVIDGATKPTDVADAITLTSGGSNDRFGWGLDAGDADGDGLADLAVVSRRHAAYLFLGPITADEDVSTCQASWRDPYLLEDVDIVGDMDGDSVSDIVVSAPVRGGHIAGAVYVVPGDAAGAISIERGATHIYHGDALEMTVGQRSDALGDHNGDGLADLVLVSDFNARENEIPVFVIDGGDAPGVYDVASAASATLQGHPGSRFTMFGDSVGSTDFDGDGLADLLVGATTAYVPDLGGQGGAVFGFLGPLSGAMNPEQSSVRWEGAALDSRLGIWLATGDVDGDGWSDVLMTDYQSAARAVVGAAYLQTGPATGVIGVDTLVSFAPSAPVSSGGLATVAFLGDWSGDGGDEVVYGFSSHRDDMGNEIPTSAHILYSDHLF